MSNLQEHPHRRYNQLTGEWILVSPHRSKRPWQGKTEKVLFGESPQYDPICYLCPGNTRAGGVVNENYTSTYVFTNDFAALTPEDSGISGVEEGLFKAESVRGICRVICFSPDHSLTLPKMDIEDIIGVIKVWKQEFESLGTKDFINYVQIFENKGDVMGCSNPHPHGQIWASSNIPDEPAKEQIKQLEFYQKNEKTLLSVYLEQELEAKERIVLENEEFVALVPYWAVWPFETMIISKQNLRCISQMDEYLIDRYADILKRLTIKYDNLFETSFPYSAGIHQAPTDGKEHPEWHFHMHFYPPLLRSATVKKFMVGYEMLGNPQRDITAEYSAKVLRELPELHYLKS